MYKTITLNYLEAGQTYNSNTILSFSNENLATEIRAVIPEGYEDFTFVMDCKNGIITKQYELGTGLSRYTLLLDDSLTLTGNLELQLWATVISGTETVKVQWEKYNLTITDALNISEITAEANPDIIATHTAQIAELVTKTDILDTTGVGTKFLADNGVYKDGAGGTYDYLELDNKPTINSIELRGNKTSGDLGLQPAGSYLTAEVDPTVPSWAKESTKPSYLVSEITGYETLKTFAGFVNRTDSTITVNGSGVVTLAPATTSFTVYTMGTKHVLTNTQTVTVTEDQNITYVYLDSAGVLQKSITAWDLTSGLNIPVAIVFKDGSIYALTDERHGHERNKAWHNWAHNNIGAMYNSGLTGTFGNTTLSVTQGVIYDEDLKADTGSTRTTCSLWYRNATTGMRLIRGSNYAKAVSVGGILQYDNGSGTLQDVTNNRYATNWVYATNDPTEPIYCVVGQGDYSNLTGARNASAPTINLSTAEWKLIYRVIYQRTAGTPSGVYVESADFRTVQTGVPTSASTTDHNALINRDATNSHPASAISYDNGGEVLTNVQTELDGRLNKTYTLTIDVGEWSTNSYAQVVTGLTDNDLVLIQAPDSYYSTYGLSYTQSGDTITFTVTSTPAISLSIGIGMVKCSAGGSL
jgi:hypothetical protein